MDDKNLTNQSLHNKLDQLIWHFVDFQKSQNEKQRALDEKLVKLTTQFEKEKSFSREPQNETQNVCLSPVQQAQLSDSGQVSPQPIYKSIPGLTDIMKEVRYKLKGLDEKTDLIQNSLFGTCDDVGISENLRGLKIELEQVNTSIISLAGRLEIVETSLATVVQKIDSVETSLNDGQETVKEDLEKSMATVVQKIDSVKTSLNDEHKAVKEDFKKNMATVVQKIESVKTSLNDGQETVKEEILSLKEGQDLVKTKIEQSTNEVKDYIYWSKREIFAVTEKEAQIVRDRIEGPLPSRRKYSFDFCVENFNTLVRSDKFVHSPPWHINEAKTSVVGLVWFAAKGDIIVLLSYARRPRQVGLQPPPARKLQVKATICDPYNKELPDIVLGEETWDMDETLIPVNGDCGRSLGNPLCADLISKGYGRRDVFGREAIMVRYDVTVL